MLVVSALARGIPLSPLLIVLVIVVAAILVARARRRAALILLGTLAVLLCALSLPVVSGLLLGTLENRVPPLGEPIPAVDGIVVLGGGLRMGAPDEGGQPSLTATAEKRLVAGYLLYERLGVHIYVSGGKPWRGAQAPSEADVAARLLERLGAPSAAIVIEGGSDTTWDNARLLAPLLAAHGARRVALVTSAVHMPRALIAFRRAGIDVVPAPTDYLTQTRSTIFIGWLPSFEALRESFLVLEEYCGAAVYALRR
jgi:uncharacterized SAM-binding protein YcdF (DUF218 family)